jgi:magnesium chelatase subunit I
MAGTSGRTVRSSGWDLASRAGQGGDPAGNAVTKIAAGEPLFEGVLGYEDTVMPQLENALLAGHDVIFLGERGQAKTRMIRSLTGLLDEWMPIVAGSEINDDPYHPVSKHARDLVAEHGDDTPIDWVHRDQRFGEKLATPDTSIADLIGEVDPIKVAEGRYLSDELTLHYGSCPAPTAASSPSTSSPTSPSGSRSACSTCSRSATSRCAATRSACRST